MIVRPGHKITYVQRSDVPDLPWRILWYHGGCDLVSTTQLYDALSTTQQTIAVPPGVEAGAVFAAFPAPRPAVYFAAFTDPLASDMPIIYGPSLERLQGAIEDQGIKPLWIGKIEIIDGELYASSWPNDDME